MNTDSLHKIEKCIRHVDVDDLVMLADCLGVPPRALITPIKGSPHDMPEDQARATAYALNAIRQAEQVGVSLDQLLAAYDEAPHYQDERAIDLLRRDPTFRAKVMAIMDAPNFDVDQEDLFDDGGK